MRWRKELKTFRHELVICRACGMALDAATDVRPEATDQAPSNDSFSLCAGCGEVSVFVVEDGQVVGLREPSFVELAIFNQDFGYVARQAAELRVRRARGEQPPSE